MRRIISKNWLRLSLTFLVSFGVSLALASAARTMIFPAQSDDGTNVVSSPEIVNSDETTDTPDFQAVIDNWLAELPEGTTVGIAIYNIGNSIPVASTNANTVFSNGNFSRWLLGYDGYNQISLGLAAADEFLTSDYYAEYSLSDCLEAHLTGNNQTCTAALEDDQTSQTRITDLINAHGLVQTDLIDQTTTAYELGELLQSICSNSDIDESYWEILYSTITDRSLIDGFTVLDVSEGEEPYLIVALSPDNANIETSLTSLLERLKGAVSAI